MLDRKFLLENAEDVERNCLERGLVIDISQLVELETGRRENATRIARAESPSQ